MIEIIFSHLSLVQLCFILLLLQTMMYLSLSRRYRNQHGDMAQIRKELSMLLMCERGIAERIRNQQSQMRGILDRQEHTADTGTNGYNYKQAAALLKNGLTTEQLVNSCDLSRGELELISYLHHLKGAGSGRKAA